MNDSVFWVYLLRCADGSYYVGHTDNLERRVAQHKRGEIAGYTAVRLPVQLAWSQTFDSRDEAFQLERQLKGWSRAKKEAFIRGDMDALRQLARSRTSPRGSTSSP
jgi:predicted GIY-YIG superfamily endonuclease